MPIDNLRKFVELYAPNAVKVTDLAYYKGCTLAINASLLVHQSLTSSKGGKYASRHILGFLIRTENCFNCGFFPLYVFDGETEAQNINRQDIKRKLEDARKRGDEEDVENRKYYMEKPSPKIIEESKQLLRLMGIKFVQADGNADECCAALARNGFVCAVATTNTDVLACGTSYMVSGIMNCACNGKRFAEYDYYQLMSAIHISREQFVDLCILLGCDFCDKINGIGPENVLKIIRKYKSIEAVIKSGKYVIPKDWKYKDARDRFFGKFTEFNCKSLNWEKTDINVLMSYLTNVHEIDEKVASFYIKKLADWSSFMGDFHTALLETCFSGRHSVAPDIRVMRELDTLNQVWVYSNLEVFQTRSHAGGPGRTNHPALKLSILGRQLLARVTPTAVVTLVSEKFWNAIKSDYVKSRLTYESAKDKIKLARLPIVIQKVRFPICAFVSSKLTVEDVTLGMDFIGKYVKATPMTEEGCFDLLEVRTNRKIKVPMETVVIGQPVDLVKENVHA